MNMLGTPSESEQTMGIRHSCLQMAVAVFTNSKGETKADADTIIGAAEKFAAFVVGPKPEKNDNVQPLKAVT